MTNLSQIDRKLEVGQVGQKVITNISEIGHLDSLIVEGEYFANGSSVASTANGFPLSGGGFLTVKKNSSNNYHQEFRAYAGYAYRWGALSGGVVAWEPWHIIKNSSPAAVDITNILVQGAPVYKLLNTTADFNENIDLFLTEGMYQLRISSQSVVENGFPFNSTAGFLTVKVNGSNIISQMWETYNGYAYRWGVLNFDKTQASWNAWRGVKHSQDGIVDLYAIIAEVSNTKKKFVVFGSSTTFLLTDYFTDMCARKNLTYINHGVNGDNLGGSGLAQGSNIVTLQFPDGIISATATQTVTIEASFGGSARHNRTVELSNGVRGIFYTDGTFKASNLTGDLIVSSVEKYRAIEPTWFEIGEGVYIFNIGKNDVSTADANYIFNNTLKMIDYLPSKAKSVVLGHFPDTNGSAESVAKIEDVNNRLHLKFGLRYIDIVELLFSDSTWTELGLTKTAADEAAILAKKLPPSLGRDNGHLSVDMSNILGRAVEDRLAFLGYI